MIGWNARFAIAALLLAGTALFLEARARTQFVPLQTSLASFPTELENWVGADVPIPDEDRKTLGPGEFLQRTYKDRMNREPYVDLYVAYVPDQHGLYRHLPKDCLLGSGWMTTESGTTALALPANGPFTANRYLITKGSDRQLVLFWYSAHGRRVASVGRIDLYLMFDSLLVNRADNALIRMNTELLAEERPDQAQERLVSFAALVNPVLDSFIPD